MKPSVVFFGTGPVSIKCLEGIADAVTVEAIFTKPPRRAPNGTIHPHPVKSWGEAHGSPVIQVANRQELEIATQKGSWLSRVGVAVDFGLIIPESVINTFPLGIINSHFSLLPQLRGADPITFAILEAKEQTGVSLMKIVSALDEGPLLKQATYQLPSTITTPELTEALTALSNKLLHDCLPKYLNGELVPHPQPDVGVSYTRKLTKADGVIDWSKPAAQLEREVRAFLGWPGSRTRLFDKDIIITASTIASAQPAAAEPGVAEIKDAEILVATGDGTLAIQRLKPVGKREMTAAEFARGIR